jgi:cell division protein FtsQ
MKDWKNILGKVIWAIAAAALIVLFVFAWKAKGQKKCTGVQIELVGDNTAVLFLDEAEIKRMLAEQGVKVGVPILQLNLVQLEQSLSKTKWVRHAEIFIDNLQQVQVRIEQRAPIARVFTASGNSFYVDSTATRLPLKQLSVMRLPIVTGFPSDQVILSKPDSALLNDVIQLVKMVRSDSFFTAQVAQLNIAPNGDFELVPTLGDHLVLLGSIENMEDKLNRLYTFYKHVWVKTGINAYQVLDCRFDHQIVALKKGMQPISFVPSLLPFTKMGADSTKMPTDTSVLAKVPAPTPNSPLKKTDTLVKPAIVAIPGSLTTKNTTTKPAVKPAKSMLVKSLKVVKPAHKKIIPKWNNKLHNKSLNNKKKTAKAVMPKKTTSNNN